MRHIIPLLLLLANISTAIAGDFARRDILGFSKDGQLFAFEEYGIQDGSGFPYSNIYIIDTKRDSWTAGSPYRVLIKDIDESAYDETGLTEKARSASHNMAANALSAITQSGLIVATNRPTERTITPGRMEFFPRLIIPPIDKLITMKLDTYQLNGGPNCQGAGETRGFRLTRLAGGGSSAEVIMHEDQKIPKSRFCPRKYNLADVVTYFPTNGDPVVAVLILMQRFGFEGPDGRYLAITGPLY